MNYKGYEILARYETVGTSTWRIYDDGKNMERVMRNFDQEKVISMTYFLGVKDSITDATIDGLKKKIDQWINKGK